MSQAAKFSGFPEETFRFLSGITKNNNKAWFEAHRDLYEQGYIEPAKSFVSALGPHLRRISPTVQFEPKVNGSLFRINRDIRFSKDKTPYKNHIDLWFWHGGHRGWDMPGFYFRMFADRLIFGVGMHRFEKKHLDAYRRAVVAAGPGQELVKAITEVRSTGRYQIGGASRKTVPRGFDANHERADLLLHEGLWADATRKIGNEPRSARFIDVCAGDFAAMWPIARWLLQKVTSAGT